MKKTSPRVSKVYRGRSYKAISEEISRANFINLLAAGQVMFPDRPTYNATTTSIMKKVKRNASSNISFRKEEKTEK
jgi:hypothetical protein